MYTRDTLASAELTPLVVSDHWQKEQHAAAVRHEPVYLPCFMFVSGVVNMSEHRQLHVSLGKDLALSVESFRIVFL